MRGRGPLGCGQWTVELRCAGGGKLIARLPWSRLAFGYVLDDTSTASVTVERSSHDCWRRLSCIVAWEWELHIYRRRPGWPRPELAWCGPLMKPQYSPGSIEVRARDLSAWFDVRLLLADREFTQVDLAAIFAQMAEDALRLDPTPNVRVRTHPTGIPGDRRIVAKTLTFAAEGMRELARNGLDWTQVGREVRAGNVEVPTSPLPPLLDWTMDVTGADGVDAPSEVFVVGGTGSGSGRTADEAPVAAARVEGSRTPLVQEVHREDDVLDQFSCDAAAATRAEWYANDPVHVSGILSPKAPLDLADLVPGALAELHLDQRGRPVHGLHRLERVSASVSAAGDGITEQIEASFGPVGTTESLAALRRAVGMTQELETVG